MDLEIKFWNPMTTKKIKLSYKTCPNSTADSYLA